MKLLKIYLAVAAAIFILAFIFSGCSSTQKAISKLNESPLEAAKYCAEKFPVKDTIIIKKDSISFDTLVLENMVIDTIHSVYNDTVRETIIKTLPAKTITKTVTQVKEVVRENTARVKQLEMSLQACDLVNNDLTKEVKAQTDRANGFKKERNKWRLYFFILLASVIGWKFRKLIFKII